MVSKDRKRWSIAGNIVMALLSFTALMPFLLLIISSLTDENTALKYGYSYFPRKWSLAAYQYLISQGGMILRAYGITILTTVVGTVLCLIITSMLAYMLTKEGLPGVKIFNFLIVFTMLFNGGLVPTYVIYSSIFHIKNTFFALVVPGLLMNAFNVILVKNYFKTSIPGEILEAARIDGAGEATILFRIVIPLSKPILATIGMMAALAYWNDWQNGLYYLNDSKWYSIQLILNQINSSVQYLARNAGSSAQMAALPSTTARMAIAVIGILPLLIIYPFFQDSFAKGLVVGGVKG